MAEELEQTKDPFDSPGWRWIQDFAGDFASGTALRYTGKGLQRLPKVKGLGSFFESLGKTTQLVSAPNATINAYNRAAGWDNETPTTATGHAKKWLRSAGTEAALGTAMMAAGMGLSAIPHPATAAGGRILAALGKAGPWLTSAGTSVRNFSLTNATFGTAADLLGNHLQKQMERKEEQQRRIQEMQKRYARDAERTSIMAAGMAGLAGLGGAHMLISAIPALKRKKYLKYLAYMLAAGGAGYAGWRYANNQQNKYKVV